MPKHDRVLVWLRRDLRLHDHTALAEATRHASRVAVAFVYDTVILDELSDRSDRRVFFIHQSLEEVADRLREAGSDLIALPGDPLTEIPALARRLGVDAVYCSHDDDPYALKRDRQVARELGEIQFESFKDHVIFERQEVMNQSGEPYRVYTPYMKAWRSQFDPKMAAPREPDLGRLWPAAELKSTGNLSLGDIGFEENSLWVPPGSAGGHERLSGFVKQMEEYGERRDYPGIDGTSGLSVHLRHGTVSIRECVRAALNHPSKGAEKWFNELIWREFYHMILANFPHVVESSFREEYSSLKWPGKEEHFAAWCEGRTGYPIVDAAMRCINATGWMHNRLRTVCASFLTKDLLVDWRQGEAYFAEKLLDFELASNNGGWQWAASVGVDAQPYFRIFNPILQSRKFDPGGDFIREWVPELKDYSSKTIHFPAEASPMEQISAGCEISTDYPEPVVDHKVQKELAVRLLSLG